MKSKNKKAFTIVELLTVMAVIAILIGLLVPALDKVRRIAKDVQQKAQFHSIEVALEIFKNQEEEYPPSAEINIDNSGPMTVGAMRLAEALIGRDMRGFDPQTSWDADEDKNDPEVYANEDAPKSSTQDMVEESLDRRKGPFLKLENIAAYNVGDLFDNTGNVYSGDVDVPAPVFCDVYRNTRRQIEREPGVFERVKVGCPILYFRADTSKRDISPDTQVTPTNERIYNHFDNFELIELGQMQKQNEGIIPHKISQKPSSGDYTSENYGQFYEQIRNPQAQDMPYNADSFILISAGYDGEYGTSDDIMNFKGLTD